MAIGIPYNSNPILSRSKQGRAKIERGNRYVGKKFK